jgi:hypothetical protein
MLRYVMLSFVVHHVACTRLGTELCDSGRNLPRKTGVVHVLVIRRHSPSSPQRSAIAVSSPRPLQTNVFKSTVVSTAECVFLRVGTHL